MTRFLLIMLVGVLSSCNVIAPIAAVIEPEDTTAGIPLAQPSLCDLCRRSSGAPLA